MYVSGCSFYVNNCNCAENTFTDPTFIASVYRGTTAYVEEIGFGGLKLDSCSQFRDTHLWAFSANSTGRDIMIEDCHNMGGPRVISNETGELDCPMHIWRTGNDITPGSWDSFLLNFAQLSAFLAHEPILSKPNCWAYPDAVQSGSFRTFEEDRSNFGAWCVSSSPLILGTNITHAASMARVIPILTNEEAIAVNRQFSGHPGKLKMNFSEVTARLKISAVPCDGGHTQTGWRIENITGGMIIRNDAFPGMCVDASEPGGQGSPGLGLRNCSTVEDILGCQRFVHDASGNIHAPDCLSNEGLFNDCFDISGKKGPNMQLTHCYDAPNDHFTFCENGIWHSESEGSLYPERCVQVEAVPSPVTFQVWSKPQPAGALAVYFLNALERTMPSFEVDLAKDLGISPATIQKGFQVRDIWNHRDLTQIPPGSQKLSVQGVTARDSVFLLLKPHDV